MTEQTNDFVDRVKKECRDMTKHGSAEKFIIIADD